MPKDIRLLGADAVERVNNPPLALERQQPFGGLMRVLAPDARSHQDCIAAEGWPEWLPHLVTDLHNADVGDANEWASAYEWGIELATALAQPLDYSAARYRFLHKLLQPLAEQAAPVPIEQVVTLLERALSDDPPSGAEWSTVWKTVWRAGFDAWDDARPRQHDIWDAASATARNTAHGTERIAGALAWGDDEHAEATRGAQRTALIEALRESAARPSSPPIAGGAPCPCEGGAFCDASCVCRCAEGLCGDCEPLSGEERGYCSCADGKPCPMATRADGPHVDWVADYDHVALREHPGIAYPVFTAGYVLPWAEGGAVSWTNAARLAEVGGPGERRQAIIPLWEGPLDPSPPTLRELGPPRAGDRHCLELTRQGLANLCGFGEIAHPERNVLWGADAVSCRRCRELLMQEPSSHVPIAGGAPARCGYGWECDVEATGDGYCERHGEVVEVRRAIFRSGASVPSTDDLDVLRALLPNGSARIAGGSGEDEPVALAERDRARMLSASAGAAFQFQPLEVGRGWRAGWSWRDAAHVVEARYLRPRRSYVVSGAAVEARLKRGDNAAGPPRYAPIADEAWRALSVPIAGGAPQGDPAADDKQIERWARHDSQVRALACMEIHALGDDPREREYIATVRRDLESDAEASTFPRHEEVGQGCTPALCVREGWTLRDDSELVRWPREQEPLRPHGAYERSLDGEAWEPVSMGELRRTMASRWIDITQAIAMLDEGRELPSVAAWYRRRPVSPPIAGASPDTAERRAAAYPYRCRTHMLTVTATARCGDCGGPPNAPRELAAIRGGAPQSEEQREHAALAAASRPGVQQVYPSLAAATPCPCDGGPYCDAACECRCAEGRCAGCKPLSAREAVCRDCARGLADCDCETSESWPCGWAPCADCGFPATQRDEQGEAMCDRRAEALGGAARAGYSSRLIAGGASSTLAQDLGAECAGCGAGFSPRDAAVGDNCEGCGHVIVLDEDTAREALSQHVGECASCDGGRSRWCPTGALLAGEAVPDSGPELGNRELAAIIERALRTTRAHSAGWSDQLDRRVLSEARDAIDRVLRETGAPPEADSQWLSMVRALACMELHTPANARLRIEHITGARRELGSESDARSFSRHQDVKQRCSSSLCVYEGWTLRDHGEVARWPREDGAAQAATYERSPDGETWEPAGKDELRRALAVHYPNVLSALALIDVGHVLVAGDSYRRSDRTPIAGGAPVPDDDGEPGKPAAGSTPDPAPALKSFFSVYPEQDDVEGWDQYQREWEDEHTHGDCDGDLDRCMEQCPACKESGSACTPCKESRTDPLFA